MVLFNTGLGGLAQEGRQPCMASRPRSQAVPRAPHPQAWGAGTSPRSLWGTGWWHWPCSWVESQLVVSHLQELRTHIPGALALGAEQELVVAAIGTDC